MIFHSKEHNTIYYSHGKVGSSSLAMALNAMKPDHDWIDSSSKHYTVAEIKEKFPDYKMYVLIRDPYKRYISGLKENIIGPHMYGTEPVLDLTNPHPYYLMKFDTHGNIELQDDNSIDSAKEIPLYLNPKYTQTQQFWRSSLRWLFRTSNYRCSFHDDEHLANWLWKVLLLQTHYDVTLITGNVFDHFHDTYSTNHVPDTKNKSNPAVLDNIANVLAEPNDQFNNMPIRYFIDTYQIPEVRLFNTLLNNMDDRNNLTLTYNQCCSLLVDYHNNIINHEEQTQFNYAKLYRTDLKLAIEVFDRAMYDNHMFIPPQSGNDQTVMDAKIIT